MDRKVKNERTLILYCRKNTAFDTELFDKQRDTVFDNVLSNIYVI